MMYQFNTFPKDSNWGANLLFEQKRLRHGADIARGAESQEWGTAESEREVHDPSLLMPTINSVEEAKAYLAEALATIDMTKGVYGEFLGADLPAETQEHLDRIEKTINTVEMEWILQDSHEGTPLSHDTLIEAPKFTSLDDAAEWIYKQGLLVKKLKAKAAGNESLFKSLERDEERLTEIEHQIVEGWITGTLDQKGVPLSESLIDLDVEESMIEMPTFSSRQEAMTWKQSYTNFLDGLTTKAIQKFDDKSELLDKRIAELRSVVKDVSREIKAGTYDNVPPVPGKVVDIKQDDAPPAKEFKAAS